MGKKRKHSEEIADDGKKDDSVPERPKRTLLGWKDGGEPEKEKESDSVGVFRNKEKVLVTSSRRISYRLIFYFVVYYLVCSIIKSFMVFSLILSILGISDIGI